jgi:hypothetical protein
MVTLQITRALSLYEASATRTRLNGAKTHKLRTNRATRAKLRETQTTWG